MAVPWIRSIRQHRKYCNLIFFPMRKIATRNPSVHSLLRLSSPSLSQLTSCETFIQWTIESHVSQRQCSFLKNKYCITNIVYWFNRTCWPFSSLPNIFNECVMYLVFLVGQKSTWKYTVGSRKNVAPLPTGGSSELHWPCRHLQPICSIHLYWRNCVSLQEINPKLSSCVTWVILYSGQS